MIHKRIYYIGMINRKEEYDENNKLNIAEEIDRNIFIATSMKAAYNIGLYKAGIVNPDASYKKVSRRMLKYGYIKICERGDLAQKVSLIISKVKFY